MLNNVVHFVKVVKKNNLHWCGNVKTREEESILRNGMKLKTKGKTTKRKTKVMVA